MLRNVTPLLMAVLIGIVVFAGVPTRRVTNNRDLLDLLADYESLRRRANVGRAAVHKIFDGNGT